MNNLLRGLAQKNSFNFAKVEPSQIPNDRFDIEKPLVQFVQETKKVRFNTGTANGNNDSPITYALLIIRTKIALF